jgi:Putative 2OG-Fe(II) oxygenase
MSGTVSISGTAGGQAITDHATLARRDAVTQGHFSAALFAHLFPAPFMIFVWPDGAELNEELRPRILEHASRSAGLQKSNDGGWHSEPGQLEFCGDPGRRLVRHMYEMGDEATRRTIAELPSQPAMSRWTFGWTLHAWANVNGPGDFNRLHTHAGSTWSGVYYVDTGALTDGDGTPLHFFDPCQGRANTFLQPVVPARYTVRAEPGAMVLFPSYIPHMVFPHRGERQRISIAFNLRKEPFP